MPTPEESRTDSKLEFAEIHLREIERFLNGGGSESDPCEIAHEESLLFHLLGVVDAFLMEINRNKALGLKPNNVNKNNVAKALGYSGSTCPALQELHQLESDQMSWLATARVCRNRSTHQYRVARMYDRGAVKRVEITDPRSGKPLGEVPMLYESWITKMRELIARLRTMI